MRIHCSAALIGAAFLAVAAFAPASAQIAGGALDDSARHTIVEAAAQALRDRYVYPDLGEQAAAAIESALAAGDYDAIVDPAALAERLTADLTGIAHDRHMFVSAPVSQPPAADGASAAPPPRPLSEGGVTRADMFDDGVGYIEVFAFPSSAMFAPPVDRAMAALADARVLIVDVRRNIGGDPASVNHLLSYFVENAPLLAGSSVSRTPGTDTFTTQEFWIDSTPPVSFAGKPVFVLTGPATFSGGEAFAFHMQTLNLGTLVGETTAGAANITNTVPLAQGFQISVPYARGEGSTWEGGGVSPDIVSPAAGALTAALGEIGPDAASGDVDALSRARVFTPRSTPAPGGEAAVRRMTEELRRGAPDYNLLNEAMANALRERLPALHDLFAALGPVESVAFFEADPFYGDIYDMRLANGAVYWAVALDPAGQIVMWEVNAAPRADNTEPQ